MDQIDFLLKPIGVVKSELADVENAPKQGFQGAPDAWIVIDKEVSEGIKDIKPGDEIIVLTWLHFGDRKILSVYPQDNKNNPLTSVFATRSADRPNPIGMHPVEVLEVVDNKIRVAHMEAIDGTPVIDIKPVI